MAGSVVYTRLAFNSAGHRKYCAELRLSGNRVVSNYHEVLQRDLAYPLTFAEGGGGKDTVPEKLQGVMAMNVWEGVALCEVEDANNSNNYDGPHPSARPLGAR